MTLRPLIPLLLVASALTATAHSAPPPGLAAEVAAPFSFYLVPSDVIGLKDCPQGFQVTHDGALNNGYGELDLSAGFPATRVDQRVKTLYKGYLPIVEYGFARGGIKYSVQMVGTTHNLDPSEDLVALVRVRISNPGSQNARATLEAHYNPRNGDGRSDVGCHPWYQAKFMDAAKFATDSGSSIRSGKVVKNGHLVFAFTGLPRVDARNHAIRYTYDLGAGSSTTLYLAVPFVPVDVSKPEEVDKVARIDYDNQFAAVARFWDDLLKRATSIQLDDPKVVDTVRASLEYDLIARDIDEDGTHFTQTVNKFQYHGFFMRDSSFIARSYELMNLPDVARTTVEHYLIRDAAGKVLKLRHEAPDDWGQSLWALGSYLRTTGDVRFAREILPAIGPHLDDFVKQTSSDPLGLWPVAGPYDNELINGHYTSHDLWALLGLREAQNICRLVGDSVEAARAGELYAHFRSVFLTRLSSITSKAEGYIPPGMDDPKAGDDWENASGGVYPFGVLPPFHPWVTATLAMEREYKYREGIMTYGPNAWVAKLDAEQGKTFDPMDLHDYDTFQVTEALLARGEQRKVVEDLYSTLVHTSSTHAGFETSIAPWGNRDPGGNFPPHGWFAARYNELVRNMLIREDGASLHLFSALAPRWIQPGRTVRVSRGLTNFGTIDLGIRSKPDGADVSISARWRTAPKALVFHIPWFVKVSRAIADGKNLPITNGALALAPNTRHLQIKWTWTEHPDLSYERAVKLWLHKAYEPRPGEDMDHLFPTPSRPGLAEPQTLFADSYPLCLISRSGVGTVHFTLDGSVPKPSSPKFLGPVTIRKTTTVRAIEVWPDGRVSEPLVTRINKAEFLQPVSVANVVPGLNYVYSEGNYPAMPDFTALSPARVGVANVPDLDAIQHRPEQFALDIRGYLRVPKDGVYTLITGSDDGSKLWIGDRLVVDNDGPHAYQEQQGQLALKAGLYPVRIAYFDAGGANYLHVFWTGPVGKKRPIPASAWFHRA
jgi:hypothetical protein